MTRIVKDRQYYQFSFYGFLKNLRFFDAYLLLVLVDKGLSFTLIGLLYGGRELLINVMEVPSGLVADTYGRRAALLFSFVLYMLSFLLFYFADGPGLLALAFAFFGIADAFRSGTHKGMIMDYLRRKGWIDQKIDYYGHTRSWSQMGSALSALMGGILAFSSGHYRSLFLFSLLPYLLNLLNVATYSSLVVAARDNRWRKASLGQTARHFIRAMKHPAVLTIVSTSALHTAYLKALKDYIQLIMLSLTMTLPFFTAAPHAKREALLIGLLYFLLFLFTSLASKYAGLLPYRNKRRVAQQTLMLGLIAGLASGLAYEQQWLWLALLFFALVYGVENLRKPILTGFVADETPPDILTSVLSAQSLLKTLFTALIALIFGMIADHSSLGMALVITTSLLLTVYLVLLLFRRHHAKV